MPDRADDLSDWWIKVRPLPHDVPAAVRVRRFIKAALRAYSLKAEAIQAVPPREVAGAATVAKAEANETADQMADAAGDLPNTATPCHDR